METDTIKAWQVERGDFILLGGEYVWQVEDADDCTFFLRDEDGEVHDENPLSFEPDEDVEIVVKWDDDLDSLLVDPE